MILLLLGRSGCGKSRIEELLISRRRYRKVVTCTTRKRREGESEDSYHFMTKDEFLIHLSNGDFVEWDKYGDNFYGTLKESLEGDGMLVCAITPEGAANIKKEFPDTFVVHVKTDMKTSVMRAVSRETELDPGKMHRIYQRSVQDHHIYEDPACDYTAENPEGTNLRHLAEKIADEHLRFVSSSLLKSTSKILKESAEELREYDRTHPKRKEKENMV